MIIYNKLFYMLTDKGMTREQLKNAVETYESLKKDYKSLKAILTSLGVNLTEIDDIKE